VGEDVCGLTYQGDDLGEAPTGEQDCEKHLGGVCVGWLDFWSL
jgi:hypothetical protein